MTKPIITRFAPSPTGLLQVGNVRAALFNWLFTRKTGGQFMLRLDDTDTERSTPAFARAIEEDLTWLGLTWDLSAKQSDRLSAYDGAAQKLKEMGRLYACYETGEELERKRRMQRARGMPPVYDRSALSLSDADRAALEAEGRRPHWRFKLDGRTVGWEDEIRGTQTIETSSQSDPVLIRADGSYLYTLPSIIDDIDFNISHVVRGEDHVANTGTQIEIIETLGATPPVYGHFSMLTDADGGKLSKRLGSLSVQGLREEGVEPAAILSLLARLGTSDPVEPIADIAKLVEGFAFERIGRAPARFDPAELAHLNGRLLHEMDYSAVADRLAALSVGGGEAFWQTVRPNLTYLKDAAAWWSVVEGPISPEIGEEDKEFIASSAAALPGGELTEETWGAWTGALKKATGRKGKSLFMPLRLALTGRPHGPEMKTLLPLIGRERVLARLAGDKA